MNSWALLDKLTAFEEFPTVVHHNEGINNFSVKLSDIFTTNSFEKVPKFRFALRIPYVCLYFDNVLLLYSSPKCEKVQLFKTFEWNIAGLIILKAVGKLLIILENGLLHLISLETIEETNIVTKELNENFTQLTIYEQSNSFILASNSVLFHELTLSTIDDGALNFEEFELKRIKYSNIDSNIVYQIELAERDLKPIHASSVCLKSSTDNRVLAVCPITNQSMLLSEIISAKTVHTFYNTGRFLYLQELSDDSFKLNIANLLNFEVEFEIPVSRDCFVIGGVDDSAVYVDVKCNKIHIYQIQENSPLSQLEILIAARNYEEAEAFAKLNNLSPAAVLELKAKCLLVNLKKQFVVEPFNELREILCSCENVDFILNCCLEGVETNIDLYILLELAKKYFKSTENVNLKERLSVLIWKADAFKLLEFDDIEEFTSWQEFVNSSALKLLIKFLSNDRLDSACIIWLKCYPYVIHQITQQNVSELLYSVPQETKLNGLLRWLENFIPNILIVRPFSTDIFISWAQEKILELESSKHWPEIGIQLADKLFPLIFGDNATINFVSTQTEKLKSLLHSIKNIHLLKTSYNIVISLKNFMTLSPSDLVKLILRKAFYEDLEALLTDYLEGFEVKYNINRDVLIKDHIEELISASSVLDVNKMEILLRYIHNIEYKLNCVLLVVNNAVIPWTEKVYNIAQSSLEYDHILVKSIKMEIVHAEVKAILMKYKCHELSSEDHGYLIRLIIRKGDSEMLADIEKITSVYTSLQDDAYLMCIESFLKKSKVTSAIKLFNNLENSFQAMCIESCLLKLENLLSLKSLRENVELNYLDFLKSLNSSSNTMVENLNNIFILKNKFNLKISLSEYSVEGRRRFFFTEWCKDKIQALYGRTNFVKELFVFSIHVGNYLKLSQADSCLTLLHQVSDSQKPHFLDVLYGEEFCFLNNDIKIVDIIIKLIPSVDFNNLKIVSNILKQLSDVLLNCNDMNLSPRAIDVCSWISAMYYAHNTTKEVMSTLKASPFYNPHALSPIIPIWRDILSANASMGFNNFTCCHCKLNSCENGSVCLKKLLTNLQSQQNDIHFSRISAYFVMNQLQNSLPCPTWLLDLNDTMVKTLMIKMLSAEKPDYLNISTLVLSHSSPVALLTETLTGSMDTHRKMNIAQYILLSKEMLQYLNIPYKQAFHVFSENKISTKFEKCGISCKEYQFDNNTYNVNSLIESMVSLESFNILTLEEFCHVTEISLDQALTFYLFTVLKGWNSNYDVVLDSYGNSKIISKTDTLEVLQKCLTIFNKIDSKKNLIENLTTLFQHGEINFQNLTTIYLNQYAYEVFLFIIDLLEHLTQQQVFHKEFFILKFLQTYTRVNKPTQAELDMYSIKETFPKIGYYRLPFQPLISAESWSSLKSELTLFTYERWLPVARLLVLDVGLQERYDMICSSAVRGSMAQKKSSDTENKWSLYMQNEQLLKRAHKCIEKISNLEWAGACLFLLFQGSSPGVDQVTAANMCYQFAERWSTIQPNNIFRKIQTKHLLTSTAHILNKIGLADEKLLSLCDNPHKLIEALFNHKSILTYTDCPNINGAIDEIAKINGLEASYIRTIILDKILKQNTSQILSNVHGKSMSLSDGTLNRETVTKVCYILKSTNPMMAALYLYRMALGESDSVENYNSRIRALQCLLSLADDDVIEKITSNTVINLWSKFWELYFTNYLLTIGLEFLTAIFLDNKLQALQQIWKAREHNHSTILIVIKMIIIYNIQVEECLLDEIIKSMLKFAMNEDIKKFLISIKVYYSPCYIEAWSNVLLNSFKRLDTQVPFTHKEDCYNALKMLPSCPVLSHIDLTCIWHKCIKTGNPEMSAIVIPHVPEADRKKIAINMGKVQPSLLQEIKSLKSKGIVTADIAISALKNIYKKKSSQ